MLTASTVPHAAASIPTPTENAPGWREQAETQADRTGGKRPYKGKSCKKTAKKEAERK